MTLTSAVLTLVFVMDPLGNVPLFLSALRQVPEKRRKSIILRESFIAYLILLIFLMFGQILLDAMHISQPALSISGGIILFLIALRMIFPQPEKETQQIEEPFIVPLAIPLVAGPSTMTMVMLLATHQPFEMWRWITALTIAWLITTLILLFADYFRYLLGSKGLTAMERLMGMILTTMAVQMFLTGFEQFLHL